MHHFDHKLPDRGKFDIALRNTKPCLLSDESQGHLDARLMYGFAMDALCADHYEAKRIAVLVHDVVEVPIKGWPKDLKWHHKLRLVLVGILVPWLGDLFHANARLAEGYERSLKPLLK